MILVQIKRYFYTIKNLTILQIYYLLKYKIYNPKPLFKKTYLKVNYSKINFLENDYTPFDVKQKNFFIFLNKSKLVKSNFSVETKDKLWKYNLFYFDYLISNKIDLKLKKTLINKWLKSQNNYSDERYDPYPMSIRIVNFIKFSLKNNYHNQKFLNSIFDQTINLSKKLEYNIQGNHLLTNIKSLIFSGVFFENAIANKWLSSGLDLLKKELSTQFTNNYFHKEASLLYQRIILEDLFDIYQILLTSNKIKNKNKILEFLNNFISKVYITTSSLFFNNYKFNHFNDSYLRRDLVSSKILFSKIQNYFNLKTNYDNNFYDQWIIYKNYNYKIIINCFDNLLDCQPGHIHAGLLSFELEIMGNIIFSNKGIFTYQDNLCRKLNRSTRSYNTIQIGTSNSHDVWKSFRLGRRAKIIDRKIKKNKDGMSITISHDGYLNEYGVIHTRKYILSKRQIKIIDKINKNNNKIFSRLYINKNLFVSGKDKKFHISNKNIDVYLSLSFESKIKSTLMFDGINTSYKSKMISTPMISKKIITSIKW